MNRKNLLDAFEFQNYRIFHNDVNAVPTVELNTLVLHGEWGLSLEVESSKVEFVAKALFIGGFQ